MSVSSSFTPRLIHTDGNPLDALPFHSFADAEERILDAREEEILDLFLEPFDFVTVDESRTDWCQNTQNQSRSLEDRLAQDEQIDELPRNEILRSNAPRISVANTDCLSVAGPSRNCTKTQRNYPEKPILHDDMKGILSKEKSRQNHFDQQTDERGFRCHMCHKRFEQKKDLINHLYVHSEERPFICQECGKRFKRKCHLAKHGRTHTQETTFVCHVCGKSFVLKGHLQDHLSVHPDIKRFKCDRCGKKNMWKTNLKKHLRTSHI